MVQEIEFKDKTGQSFEEFHNSYHGRLVYYLRKMKNDESIARDVADEALVKALLDIEKYDPEKANISTWVFTIGRNMMLQEIKRDKKHESIEQDHDGATIGDFLLSNISEDSEERELLMKKQLELVKKGIYELPEKYCRILLMRHIDGLSYDEISEYEDKPLNTIKSRIRGGRILLKKKLAKRMRELEEYGLE